jgi:putative hydrolase of the HAD superfamily
MVVSNWDVSLAGVLDQLGLSSYLDGVLTSAGAGARKPDPVIFDRALGLADATASEAVHVGDSPSEDVAGARAAGIGAILIDRGCVQSPTGHPPTPLGGVRTIVTLQELPALLGGGPTGTI